VNRFVEEFAIPKLESSVAYDRFDGGEDRSRVDVLVDTTSDRVASRLARVHGDFGDRKHVMYYYCWLFFISVLHKYGTTSQENLVQNE